MDYVEVDRLELRWSVVGWLFTFGKVKSRVPRGVGRGGVKLEMQ